MTRMNTTKLSIPRNSGETGYETADELARQESSSQFIGTEPIGSVNM